MPTRLKRYFRRYFHLIMSCGLFWAFAVPAGAELYRYTDENGITRLTNNKYSVPEKDRHRLEPFSEFTPVTSEIKISPVEEKTTPPRDTETVILPKTFKSPAYAAVEIVPPPEKQIPPADETPEPAAAPEKAPVMTPEKPRQTPATDLAIREPHKSRQVMIEKTAPAIKTDIKPDIESDVKPEVPPPVEIPPVKTPVKQDIPEPEATDPLPGIEKPTASPELARSAPPAQKEKPVKKSDPEPKPEPVQEADKPLPEETKPLVSDKKPEMALKTEHPAPEKEAPAPPKPAPVISKEPSAPADQASAIKDLPETSFKEPKQEPPLNLALLENTQKRLMEKKTALNEKFQSLMLEKQEIESSVDENDEESVVAYNDRVKKLNVKIMEYNLEKRILQTQIERYNRAIERQTAN